MYPFPSGVKSPEGQNPTLGTPRFQAVAAFDEPKVRNVFP